MKTIDNMNMIPFIDIMLVLLVIVLMTSSFIASGKIPVNLPKAAGEAAVKMEPAEIVIDSEGKVYFESAEISLEALREKVLTRDRETPFLLRADRDVKLQHFISVVDLLKREGYVKVAVETETR